MERRGHSLAIEADECRRLLADAGVGRLGWPASEGLVILPVNYRLAGETIVFRVDPASVLAELAEPREVAFEVDDVDPVTATAWSVLVRGTTRRADELDPVPPPPGRAAHARSSSRSTRTTTPAGRCPATEHSGDSHAH